VPVAGLASLPHDRAASAALRAPTAVLERLDQHIEAIAAPKRQADAAKPFELEQLSDKLGRGHGASLLFRLFAKTKLYRRPHGLSNQVFEHLKSVARFG